MILTHFRDYLKVKKIKAGPGGEKNSRGDNLSSIMSSNTEKDAPMKLSDFEMVRTLGSGSFGRVKYAKCKLDGKYYAVKYMKKHDIIKMKQGMLNASTLLHECN